MKSINVLKLFLVLLVMYSCKDKAEKIKTNDAKQHIENTLGEDSNLAPNVIKTFEDKFGVHEGKRRNHITGFCFTGTFELKDAEIKKLSTSAIFSKTPLKVVGRLSHKGGIKNKESEPGEYGMAFEISLENESAHNFSMNTLDFFPVSTPEGFFKLMKAKVSGKKEDLDILKAAHPEIKNFKAHYKNKAKELKNYANHQFNSVNSFYLVNEEGKKTPVRWAFVPRNEMIKIDASKEVDFYKDFQNALKTNKSLSWDMVISIANSNDPIEDSAIMWTGAHKTIVAATLTIDKAAIEGLCVDKNFDPNILSEGMAPSNDPVLKFRSPTYALSFGKRLSEKHKKK